MILFLENLVHEAHGRVDLSDDDPTGGYAYLRGRGVTDDQVAQYKLGIGPVRAKAPEGTEEGKRFNRQYRGTLRGQIVVPLYNASGVLRGIETRLWEETAERRYSQYFLDNWVEDAVYLGFPQCLEHIWATKVAYLVEGVFDFFVVQRVFPNTVSPLSAKLMVTQRRFLDRFTSHMVFLFDRDKKGRKAQDFVADKYNKSGNGGPMAHHLAYPAKDPSALYQQWGHSKFSSYLKRQSDLLNIYL